MLVLVHFLKNCSSFLGCW